MRIKDMVTAHPNAEEPSDLVECIASCFECAQACTMCADACLAESDPAKLVKCIRTDLDCADMCVSTGRILSRRTEVNDEIVHSQLHALATACRHCAEECAKHDHEHCRICADACRACAKACDSMAAALA